jgi:hypothetical protein
MVTLSKRIDSPTRIRSRFITCADQSAPYKQTQKHTYKQTDRERETWVCSHRSSTSRSWHTRSEYLRIVDEPDRTTAHDYQEILAKKYLEI